MEITTIQISQNLKKRLEELKEVSRETYEDVISRLIPSKNERGIEKEKLAWLALAEKSLAKDWDKEEDETWSKFL